MARGLTAVLAAAGKEESMADGDEMAGGRKEAPVSEGRAVSAKAMAGGFEEERKEEWEVVGRGF